MFSVRQCVFPALIAVIGVVGWLFYYQWREHREDAVILEAARRYGADPALVKAVMWRETWFDPSRVGRAGEIGLMQLRTLAAREWVAAEHVNGFAANDLFDERTNALAGTWYLSHLLRRYERTDNPVPYALADYNAGRAHVLRWTTGAAATNSAVFIEGIGYPGTRTYVQSILRRYDHYRESFPGNPAAVK